MKYYNQLLDLGCFKKSDLKILNLGEKTIESLLSRCIKMALIKRVKYNYYVTVDIVNTIPLYSKFVVATKMDGDNYIAYHSAIEYHGFQNQVFHDLIFCGTKKVRDFQFEGIDYHFVKSRCNLQIETHYDGARVTTMERTIIDCIDQVDLAGGIEEVYRVLFAIRDVNEALLMEMLDYYDKKVLYQRAGYILSSFKDTINISDSFFLKVKTKIGHSSCYLISSKKQEHVFFDSYWGVSVPTYIHQIITKGSGIDAF